MVIDMDRVRRQIGLTDNERYTGNGVGIAVLDSGISRHPDFEGRVIEFHNFLTDKQRAGEYMDDFGHGTHV